MNSRRSTAPELLKINNPIQTPKPAPPLLSYFTLSQQIWTTQQITLENQTHQAPATLPSSFLSATKLKLSHTYFFTQFN